MPGSFKQALAGRFLFRPPDRLVWALGVTQIVGYGTLYYSFSVLAPAMAEGFSWPVAWVYGAFSLALLAGGLAAPWAGRLIDDRGAGPVLAAGSLAAAVALAGMALTPTPAPFVAGLLLIEVIASFVLYDAAFAALVQIRSSTARRDITQLTLIAGFASTLFWPLTAELHRHLDWREVYLVFAALHLVVCVPLHFWIATLPIRSSASDGNNPASGGPPAEVGVLPQKDHRTGFMLVAAGFSLGGFGLSALLVHMLPVLAAMGHGANAAAIAMIFGPAQVLGRVVNMAFGRNLPPVRLALLSAALLPAAILVLLASGASMVAGMGFALVIGLGSGLVSIVRGTVPLALFGVQGYGARLGRIAAVRLVLSAAAPFAFALAMERLGAEHALAALGAIGALGALAFVGVGRLARRIKPA